MKKKDELYNLIFSNWNVVEYSVEIDTQTFKDKLLKSCSQNLRVLMYRFKDNTYQNSLSSDNIYRINQLSTLEYLALVSFTLSINKNLNVSGLTQLFLKNKKKLYLRKTANDLKTKEVNYIKRNEDSICYFEFLIFQLDIDIDATSDIAINIVNNKFLPILMHFQEEYASLYKLYKVNVNLNTEKAILVQNLFHNFLLDINKEARENNAISMEFFESIFVKDSLTDTNEYMNIIKNSANSESINLLACLFIFLFNNAFLKEKSKEAYFSKLQRLIGRSYKGFSKRNLYLIENNYFSEDNLEFYNFLHTNKVLSLLQ